MLLSILSGGDIRSILISLLFSLPVIMFALSLHETAHGWVAYKCGDPTAYQLGRLTLNPLKHLDPIGFLCMLVFGFGWAKPVPINTRYFRNPKRGMALTAIAGPLANLLLGAVNAALAGLTLAWWNYLYLSSTSAFAVTCVSLLFQMLNLGAQINFLFALFNLIPVPPFDGSRMALAFLPSKIYFGIMRYERQIMFGILIVCLVLSRFGISPFSLLANLLTNWIEMPIANGLWSVLRAGLVA